MHRRTARVNVPSLVSALLVLLLLPLGGSALAQQLSDRARTQISALAAEKQSRTPAQKRLDANLLYTVRMSRGQPVADGVPSLETGVDVDAGGATVVDVSATVGDALLARIQDLGGEVISSHPAYRSLRARMPLGALEALAGEPGVIFVQPMQRAETHRMLPPKASAPAAPAVGAGAAETPGDRLEMLRAKLGTAFKARTGRAPLVVNVSEGVRTHKADLARANYGASGAGVKVGVLSDGVSSLIAIGVSGDLPAVTILPGQAGSGDEGTAMLEIVHDVAPDAQLYFATAFNGIASFAQNIHDLRTAGCDIIVDDVSYFAETPFQKGQTPSVTSPTNGGIVLQAVADVTAVGALCFSSAGNSGNKDDAQSGVFEGDFVDGGAAGPPIGAANGHVHNFGGGFLYDTVTAGTSVVTLYWADPLGGSTNDYDLYLLDAAGTTVLAASTNAQDGSTPQDPFEGISPSAGVPANSRLVVVLYAGSGRFFHMNTNRGRLAISTSGVTFGHNAPAAANAFGVAATPAAAAFSAGYPTGPYPGVFSSANVVELFSSDGPRRRFFNADSSAITPGNFSSTGGEVWQQPAITAADGVSCAAPGFNPFFGTSAAAPHAAAIAALVKSMNPALTASQVSTILTGTAIDIMGAGVDRDSGYGILDANAAVAATGVAPQATLLLESATATELSGNGNGFVEPGECGSLSVQLRNGSATVPATAISATLSTSTPGVTVDVASAPWADIAGGTVGTSTLPFRFHVDTSASCPLTIAFSLTVTYAGGTSPQVLPFILRAGLPAPSVSTTLDATAPPANPAYTAVTGTQTGRINRFLPASACGVSESNPGLFSASGSRMYDAYTFVNCASGPACINVSVSFPGYAGSVQLFAAAYANSFDPNNPSTNWLGDAASSFSSMSFSVNVNAGQTFVVVVHEVNPGAAPSYAYTLDVDGACFPCASYTTNYACCPTGSLTVTAPSSVGPGSPNRTASVPNHAGSSYGWIVTNGSITGGQGTSQITFTAGASGSVDISVTETLSTGCQQSGSASVPVGTAGSAVLFYTAAPCRVVDTRGPDGPRGGPVLAPSSTRSFPVGGFCGVPLSAKAVSVNLAVVPTGSGHFRLYPGNGADPGTASINFGAGQIRSNNAILLLATDGSGTLNVVNASQGNNHFILDVNGWFE